MLALLLISAADLNSSFLKPQVQILTETILQDDTAATALGGYLDVETRPWFDLSAKIRFSTSQKVGLLTSTDAAGSSDLFSEEGNSFSLLNLANLRFNNNRFNAKIGRIILNTPYADPDDYRMLINTFEGFDSLLRLGGGVSLQCFGASAQSGYDAEVQNRFSPIAEGSRGFVALAAKYEPAEDQMLSLWDYHADKVANFAYATYGMEHTFASDAEVEVTFEAAQMREYADSGIDGTVFGVELEAEYEGYMAGFIYERVDVGRSKHVSDGFGDGPYETSMDELSLGEVSEENPGTDINAYKGRIGLEIGEVEVEYDFGYFDLKTFEESALEHDFYVYWPLNDQWRFYMILTDAETEDERTQRIFTRIDFTFNTQ